MSLEHLPEGIRVAFERNQEALRKKIESYFSGLQRWLVLKGLSSAVLIEEVNPDHIVEVRDE